MTLLAYVVAANELAQVGESCETNADCANIDTGACCVSASNACSSQDGSRDSAGNPIDPSDCVEENSGSRWSLEVMETDSSTIMTAPIAALLIGSLTFIS